MCQHIGKAWINGDKQVYRTSEDKVWKHFEANNNMYNAW